MPDSRKYYVISDDNCKFESLTKEEILAAIVQAIESGEISDVDTGFVTTLKEQNNNTGLKFWVGTTAQYNAIDPKEENCLYILSDDVELEDLETQISSLSEHVSILDDDVHTYEAAASYQIHQMQQQVASFELDIDGIRDDVESIEDRLNPANDTTIYSGEIPYGNNLSINTTNPIESFRLVRVGLPNGEFVLCYYFGGFIRGVGYSDGNGTFENPVECITVNIALEIDSEGVITVNRSTRLEQVFDSTTGELESQSFTKLKIAGIYGLI